MSDPRSTGRVRSFLSGISVATRIAGAVVIISVLSLAIATLIGLRTGRDLGERLYEDRLVALRSSGTNDIATQLGALERTVGALAISPQAAEASRRLVAAFDELRTTEVDDADERALELSSTYQEIYLEPLAEAGLDIDVRDLIDDENAAALYLQSTYSIGFEPLQQASTVDDARDGSAWSDVHRLIQPVYRSIADDLSLVDLLIVDPDTGYIVYSVEKRPDLGANVDVGPISGSIVSSLTDGVRDDPTGGVVTNDFRRYDPALLTTVAGMADGILDDDGTLIGVIVLLFDSSPFTATLTNDGEWDDGGFPAGGDLYLIGDDDFVRSEPRGYLTDADAFLNAAEEAGNLSEEGRAAVDLSGTTVLSVKAVEATTTAAADDDESVERRPTIDGRSAYTSVARVPFDGLNWSVVAEVDVNEATSALDDFREQLVVGVVVFVLLLAFAGVAWAASVIRPVRALSDRLGGGFQTDRTPIVIPDRSPIEFHRLAASFEETSAALDEQHVSLDAARTERLELLRTMLPTSVATRLAAGDSRGADEAPEATIVVLTFVGLAATDPGPHDDDEKRRVGLEDLLAELDVAAKHHGLEPVKVIGDEYYAACGHDRPYIDHAPRAVRFAAEAFDIIRDNESSLPGVALSAGVASGPVTVGLAGTSRLVYDVWGATAQRADRLARRAGRDRMLVAGETAERLPDTIGLVELDEVTGQTAWAVEIATIGDRV